MRGIKVANSFGLKLNAGAFCISFLRTKQTRTIIAIIMEFKLIIIGVSERGLNEPSSCPTLFKSNPVADRMNKLIPVEKRIHSGRLSLFSNVRRIIIPGKKAR